jgi:hypothetical protein
MIVTLEATITISQNIEVYLNHEKWEVYLGNFEIQKSEFVLICGFSGLRGLIH